MRIINVAILNNVMQYALMGLMFFLFFPNIFPHATTYVSIVAFLVFALTRPKIKFDKRFLFAYAFFFFCLLISAVFALDMSEALRRVWGFFRYSIPFFLTSIFIKEKKQVIQLLVAFCLVSFVFNSYVIWQGFSGNMRAIGLQMDVMRTAFVLMFQFSVLLAVSFSRQDLSAKFLWGSRLVFISSILALLANGTRGAWLACAVVALIYFVFNMVLYKKTKNFLMLFFTITVCMGTIFFASGLKDRLVSITDLNHVSNTERFLLWESAYKMFLDHKITGVGPANFNKNYKEKYILPEARERNLNHAHSNYFHLLAETGIVGLVSFLYLFGTILWISYSNFYSNKKNFMALACFFSVVAFMIQGLTEFNFGSGINMRILWFLIGMSFAMNNIYAGHIYVENNK